MHVPEPGILTASVVLYISAIGYTVSRGTDSFLAGALVTCGSVALGIWLGVVILQHRNPLIPPPEWEDDEPDDFDLPD